MSVSNDTLPSVGRGAFRYRPDPDWGRLPAGWSYVEVAGVATDSADNVYVFNRGAHPVIVFDRAGRFLRSWGGGTIVRAHGIYITADDRLFLTDDQDHTVTEYTLHGERVMTLGTGGRPSDTGAVGIDYRTIERAAGPFNLPTNLVAAGDRLYVTDGYGNARVHVFSARGEHRFSWGGPGDGPGEFNLPHGLDVDRAGRVYVADRENSRIQRFAPDGTFLDQWRDVVRPTDLFIRADGIVFVAEEGARCGLFPWMRAEPDAVGGRLSIFAPDGELLARWGGGLDPCAPADFFAPHGVWLDSRGALYVGEVNWSAGGNEGMIPPDCPCLRRYVPV